MKKAYPENIEQIGDFYKEALQNAEITPSDALWNNISSALDKLPIPSPQEAISQAGSVATKGAVGLSAKAGLIAISGGTALVIATVTAVYLNRGTSEIENNNENPVTNEAFIANSFAGKNINQAADTSVFSKSQVPDQGIVGGSPSSASDFNITEHDDQKDPVSDQKDDQEPLPEIIPENKTSQVVDSVKIEHVQPATIISEEKKDKPAGGFFEKKLKSQKDSVSTLFKPKK